MEILDVVPLDGATFLVCNQILRKWINVVSFAICLCALVHLALSREVLLRHVILKIVVEFCIADVSLIVGFINRAITNELKKVAVI